MYAPMDLVEVRAWDQTVGAVVLDPESSCYAFEYDPQWIRNGRELSPILMANRPGTFVFPELSRRTFQGLPAMLADALPDRFGNALVDAWMAENAVSRDAITPLDRLAYAADRGMGALEFHPPVGTTMNEATALRLADVVSAARAALVGDFATVPKSAMQQLLRVGTSAGGARAKAVIAYNETSGAIRSGQITAPDGFTHWLIKLDGTDTDPTHESSSDQVGRRRTQNSNGVAGYGRIEYAYYLMASASGLLVSESRLLEEGPRAHFMTKRFDRDEVGERIHMQSLCGIAGLDFNLAGAHSYAQYLQVVHELGLGLDALEEAFRRVVFNVVAMNRDDHTKNLAFLLPKDGAWSLAPAYDNTYAHNPAGQWTSQHQMTVNTKRENITIADLAALADQFGVPGYKSVTRDVMTAVAAWSEYAERAGVSEDFANSIGDDLRNHRPA